MRSLHSRNVSMVAIVAALACLAGSIPALINLNYTPADLVRNSKSIVQVEVGPFDEKANRLPVKAVKTLKGTPAAVLDLDTSSANDRLMDELKEVLPAGKALRGLAFFGDFSGARSTTTTVPAGGLHIGIKWFAIHQKDGKLEIGSDTDGLDLNTVWAGGNEMLGKVVEYAIRDNAAVIPVDEGVKFVRNTKIGTVQGPVHAVMPVDLFGADNLALYILADGGDRVFRCDDKGAWRDITPPGQMRSRRAAFGDFNGDGSLDMAAWDGQALIVRPTGTNGPLSAAPVRTALATCESLTTISSGTPSRSALLVSTAERLEIVTLTANGVLERSPLADTVEENVKIAPGPCVPADFDGDGIVDIVKICGKGLLLYKGGTAGVFAAPALAGTIAQPQKPTAICTGDFEADGRLDLIIAGASGATLMSNLGAGRFQETWVETGELDYHSQSMRDLTGCITCDINNDGRQDVILQNAQGSRIYFNRGFRCFGYTRTLCNDQEPAWAELVAVVGVAGQFPGTVADVDGNGAQELVTVAVNGDVWVSHREFGTAGTPNCAIHVFPATGMTGPVLVESINGDRPCGVQMGLPGLPVFVGRETKGILKVGTPDRKQSVFLSVPGTKRLALKEKTE